MLAAFLVPLPSGNMTIQRTVVHHQRNFVNGDITPSFFLRFRQKVAPAGNILRIARHKVKHPLPQARKEGAKLSLTHCDSQR